MKYFLFAWMLMMGTTTWAQRYSQPHIRTLPSTHPTFTYDLSASSGSTNGNSYSEVQLGLNWFVTDWLNWKNAIFTRFGSNIDSTSGLDTSLLATYRAETDEGGLGVTAFAGPGARIASNNNSAATAEAGIIFKLGGIQLGGGAKYLTYFNTREDRDGITLPKNETQYFIVLGGGGSF